MVSHLSKKPFIWESLFKGLRDYFRIFHISFLALVPNVMRSIVPSPKSKIKVRIQIIFQKLNKLIKCIRREVAICKTAPFARFIFISFRMPAFILT